MCIERPHKHQWFHANVLDTAGILIYIQKLKALPLLISKLDKHTTWVSVYLKSGGQIRRLEEEENKKNNSVGCVLSDTPGHSDYFFPQWSQWLLWQKYPGLSRQAVTQSIQLLNLPCIYRSKITCILLKHIQYVHYSANLCNYSFYPENDIFADIRMKQLSRQVYEYICIFIRILFICAGLPTLIPPIQKFLI